jgi:hypothetical protein
MLLTYNGSDARPPQPPHQHISQCSSGGEETPLNSPFALEVLLLQPQIYTAEIYICDAIEIVTCKPVPCCRQSCSNLLEPVPALGYRVRVDCCR